MKGARRCGRRELNYNCLGDFVVYMSKLSRARSQMSIPDSSQISLYHCRVWRMWWPQRIFNESRTTVGRREKEYLIAIKSEQSRFHVSPPGKAIWDEWPECKPLMLFLRKSSAFTSTVREVAMPLIGGCPYLEVLLVFLVNIILSYCFVFKVFFAWH